jgi:ribosome-binding protein aMBF1 (putative translation factor)
MTDMSDKKIGKKDPSSKDPHIFDTKPVVIYSKNPGNKSNQVGQTVTKTQRPAGATKEKDVEGGGTQVTVQVVTSEMGAIVRNGRTAKGYTQDKLASLCNVKPVVIKEIENGGCKYVPAVFNSISRILGIKIPRTITTKTSV